MRRRPVLWLALGFLAIAAVGGAAWQYSDGNWFARATEQTRQAQPTAAGEASERTVPVEVALVTVTRLTSEIRVVGSLRSNESVVIRPEVGGRVAEILFEEGQEVSAGTPLIKLDTAIAAAELDQAASALALSQANHKRAVELFERKAASAANRDQTLAALRADQANLELARARLDKLTLKAPFDGTLGLRKVSIGDYVTPGQDIVNLEDIERLKVDFRIPERYLGSLAIGQPITVSADAFPGQSFAGEVYAIDPLVDENGRAVVLRARLPNEEGVLRPGLFVSVSLLVGQRENALTIPEHALVPRGTEQLVYKIVEGKAVVTPVKTGARRDAMVEIIEGLTPGDMVVTAGQIKLRDGTPVAVQSAPPQS
ncbi:MAG TPA: efflux RND transporter periplasmic adaptor subunit [Alphaproteobacteria bacterium]|nr:efflux RND transporter periplasmic adaptor subunit [Alphaproteobacteria bacterium]